MKRRAQSILEYAVLFGLISAALVGMQLYYKRGIQAAVKLTADEMGDQQKGAADFDYKYEWKQKSYSNIVATKEGTSTTEINKEGAVNYGKEDTARQSGILTWGLRDKR